MADDSSTPKPTASGVIAPFTKLRFVSSNLPPTSIITNQPVETAKNSIIFNTYNGTTGIFMCDEYGFVKRITAEFNTDHFNIIDNKASINSKVFDVLKRQIIDDLRRELGSVNGGSTNNDHTSSSTLTVTSINPSSVSLSVFNKPKADTAIYVTYSGFVNVSDVVNNQALRLTVKDGSVPQGLSVTIGEPKTYGANQLRYPVTINYLSDPKKAENTVTLQAGNIEANIGVSVTRSSDQPARVISIRADVSSLDFSDDKDAVKTVTVSKTLSPGYRDIGSLKLSATTLQNVIVDHIDYHEDHDVFHVKLDPSVNGSVNGSITIGVENTEYNTNVRNITIPVSYTAAAVPDTPKPATPKRISSITVNNGQPIEITAGQPKTVSYDVTYTGELEDSNTDNLDIASKDGITVEISKQNKTITFTTQSNLGTKQVSFDVTSNGTNVGQFRVDVEAKRRLTLKKSIPMGVFMDKEKYLGNTYYSRNNRFYLRDLVDLSGPSGTLAIRTNSENELTADKFGTYYTINEKLVGNERLVNATIYVSEDPSVSVPFQYQVYDYPKIRIKESKEQIKLGETRIYEVEYTNNPICVNDPRFTKEVTWSILDITGTTKSGIGIITPDGTFTPNSVGECRIVATVVCKWEEYTILKHESYVPLSVVRPDAKRISRVNLQESTPISIQGGATKIINYTLELTDGVEDSKTYDLKVDNTSGPKLNGIYATVNKENRTITIQAHEFSPHGNFSLNIVSNEKVVGALPLSVDKKLHELTLNRNVGDELVMFGFGGESEGANCFSYNTTISDIVTASYGDIDVRSDALNISTDNTRRFIKTPDEDKTGDITFYIKQEPETTKTVRVKNYKHPNPYLGTNSSFGNDVTTIMGNSLDLSIWYHDEIPCIRDPKFSAIASWEVNQEFGYFMKEDKSRVQSISDVRKVEFHPHRQGTGQVTANVRCYYDGQLILEKQTSVTVNVQADPYDNYTLSGSTEKISIGQFSNTFVRRNITSVDSINQFERPQIDVKVTSGPTNGVRVSMDNNGVLTVRNALEPKYYGRTVGTVTLKLGSKSLTIPFEKVYDSPITSLSTKEFTKVVYDDDYKSEDGNIYTYIEGSIKYKDDISLPLLLEDSNGSTIRVDENDLSDIEVSFEEWGQPDKNDSLYSYWGCEIVNHGQDRFRIKVWPSNPNNDIGYESKVVVKSKVDKSKYTTAHLVFWKKNGENRFVEPTASPSPSPNPSPSPSPDPTALPESY